jgi:serine-type D-Ala-D-Ala carboxypeptidase (penicillin-binding protein 5/6)
MMTAILVIDKLLKGSINLEDQVTIDDYAASIRGSRIGLNHGDTLSVHDLLKGLMICSGNDAAVALAVHTESNVGRFVQKMNRKASALGLVNTHFTNPHGLHSIQHYSSVRDLTIVSQKLLNWHPILRISSLPTTEIMIGKEQRTIKNTNPLIGTYIGADGLKTGRTSQAGYCLAATASRNNQRLLTIVLGEPSRKASNNEIKKLLDFGFSMLNPD